MGYSPKSELPPALKHSVLWGARPKRTHNCRSSRQIRSTDGIHDRRAVRERTTNQETHRATASLVPKRLVLGQGATALRSHAKRFSVSLVIGIRGAARSVNRVDLDATFMGVVFSNDTDECRTSQAAAESAKLARISVGSSRPTLVARAGATTDKIDYAQLFARATLSSIHDGLI